MSEENFPKIQRIAGSIVPSAFAFAGGVTAGLGQRFKKGDTPPEWATVIATSLTLAPLIANFPTDAARSALRKSACKGALNAADFLLAHNAPKADVLSAIAKLPTTVWDESRLNKRNWSAAACGCALGGLVALQAISGDNLLAAYETAGFAALLGLIPTGFATNRFWQDKSAVETAMVVYARECDNFKDAPDDDIERKTRLPIIREAAEAVCEVPHANPWKALAGVGVGCVAGFLIGASAANTAADAAPYLGKFFPSAAGLLVVAAKSGADLVVSCFPGEKVSRAPGAAPRAPMWVPTWMMNRMPSNVRHWMSKSRSQTVADIRQTLTAMHSPRALRRAAGEIELGGIADCDP